MATIPSMTTPLAHFTTYYQVLLKVKIIRAFQQLGSLYARWVWKIPASDIRPFETIIVPSTKGDRRITVNAYRTKGAMAPNVGPVAVHLTWHGSGFVLNTFGESIPFVAHLLSHPLLENYPLVILDCDYAKAPEYPSPAPTDDVRDVIEYVFARPQEFDLQKVTVGGFSAGANMAMGIAATVGKEVKEGKPFGGLQTKEHPFKAVVAFYPPTEWDSRPDANPPPGVVVPGVRLDMSLVKTFDAAYFYPPKPLSVEEDAQRKERQLHTPLFTPRWANPVDFPKNMYLVTCEYDTLAEEAENLRVELKKPEYKKEVTGWNVKGVAHAWDTLVLPGQPGFEERQKAYDLAAEVIAKAGGIVHA